MIDCDRVYDLVVTWYCTQVIRLQCYLAMLFRRYNTDPSSDFRYDVLCDRSFVTN